MALMTDRRIRHVPVVEGGNKNLFSILTTEYLRWDFGYALAATATRGRLPPGDGKLEADSQQELFQTNRAAGYPVPDGRLTFDKLSSVYLTGNRTRDDAPDHLRVRREVPKELAEVWVHMCPAQVYEIGAEAGDGLVTVDVTPSNCVQCGAISAKGGRLTPAEGGSGPEYVET